MALRLTTAVPDALAPSTDDRGFVAALGARVDAALSAGDLRGYRGCLAECEEITDPQRRYQAELRHVEQGLAAAARAGAAAAPRVHAAVADAALAVLEREPREPLLLNYAAVACYELWALEAARALFSAAQRLDPTLPHLQRNLSETALRMRGNRPRRPLHASVPGLGRRAAAIAHRAQPASGLTLSLCMIVRDEEAALGRCLEAAAPIADEIIVVDTGSVDATIEIARSFGAQVIERPWTGSFAEARNASYDAATGDWLLYLDADEVLVAEDAERLRGLCGRTWREAFSFIETSHVGEVGASAALVNTALRMMRNRPEYRFEGRIHEQILHTLPTWAPGRVEPTSIRIEHFGYLDDVRAAKEKSTRNISLLRDQREAEGATTAFSAFNLGCEFAAAGAAPAAITELTEAWRLLGDDATRTITEYAPTLCVTLARMLALCGRRAEALTWATDGLTLFPDFTDLVLEQAACTLGLGDRDGALALYERCLALGDAPARYGGVAGAGQLLPRLGLARLALERGAPQDAVALLKPCVSQRPESLPVTGPYATARLAQGASPTELIVELQDALAPLTSSARRALAHALTQAGHPGAAAQQLELALRDARPRAVAPLAVALAELQLRLGEYGPAARHAAEVPDDDVHAALACRIETCARIAGNELGAARTALARAERTSLPPAERELFCAWIDRAGGGPVREGLSVAAVPLLVTMAELMLVAEQPTCFAQLRELLAGSRLPSRERVELIAEMLRRHGDHAAAAVEWLAVCAQEPDARARLGLARIAAAQGMAQDAAVFASAALELDPTCDAARELLTTLDG